jgi:hypothetical protein
MITLNLGIAMYKHKVDMSFLILQKKNTKRQVAGKGGGSLTLLVGFVPV